jgi:hypothetical protein
MLASRFSLERPLILQPGALRDCEAKVSQRRLARDAAPIYCAEHSRVRSTPTLKSELYRLNGFQLECSLNIW